MKKSNKLLLGGFLTVILMITGIHIALFAKYKNGNYTIFIPKDNGADNRMRSFPSVSFVILRNLSGVTVQFGDSVKLEKVNEDVIKSIQNGDSLIIIGQHHFGEPGDRHQVSLSLPNNVTLSVVNSFVYFENSEGNAGELSIITDSISRLSIPSKHLLKAKITTVPNNP